MALGAPPSVASAAQGPRTAGQLERIGRGCHAITRFCNQMEASCSIDKREIANVYVMLHDKDDPHQLSIAI